MTLRLDVVQQSHGCEFRLSWGDGQRLPPVALPQPVEVLEAYINWQQAYLNFYRTFRGRVVGVGHLSDVEDRRAQLVKAEADLLAEFHRWLRHPKLDPMRQQIAQLAKDCSVQRAARPDQEVNLTILLTCSPIALERLPWEAWEIGKELGTVTTICIARTPDQIRAQPVKAARRGRNRVLVILGDDTGLDFKADREAVQGLRAIADIHFVGWQPGQDPTVLLNQVTQAITDSRGWDVLLFAGHSNEAATSGGELAIAPHLSLTVNELLPSLTVARQNGLQFALFNSCSGLSIAKSLIDLGFNQVAIMREPIHNQVAQEFLVQFLRTLAQYKDVHEALIVASQALKLEKNLTFPSAALVPSLVCRPGQPWFRFRKFGWREWLRQLRPTRRQALPLAGLVGLSLLHPVQDHLLDQRLWSQAVYRRLTGQTTEVATLAPITVVQVDPESLNRADIGVPVPMNRAYLATVIEQLSQRQARVIGIDYVLDRPAPEPENTRLATVAEQARDLGTWLVWASIQESGQWTPVLPQASFPSPLSHWSLTGRIGAYPPYVPLIDPRAEPTETPLPLYYLLALVAELEANADPAAPRPQRQSQSPLITQALSHVEVNSTTYSTLRSMRSRHHLLTALAYWVGQMWLQPIVDFSLPPDQVYQTLPAWQLLEEPTSPGLSFENHIVILAPGGYPEAGITPGEDNLPLPAAVRHWRFWADAPADLITGGEIHAYLAHSLLTQRQVVPIPDLWMIGLAALLGKGVVLDLHNRPISRRQGYLMLLGATAAYGLVSLQVYISVAILVPWLLPSLTFWLYALPAVQGLSLHRPKPLFAFA